jgi:uncharacterized membrane protein YkvA (DUF1232 family)
MSETGKNYSASLRKPLANQKNATSFFSPLGKACRYFFAFFVPSSQGKFQAPADSILMLVAAVIYFVSPFDLIPDSVPVLGLIDDAALITCVAKANLNIISSFRTWEILRDRNFNPSMKYRTKEE